MKLVSEFYTRYRQEETYDIKNKIYEEVSANLCYDHVWVAALALNCTSEYLRQIRKYENFYLFIVFKYTFSKQSFMNL